MQEISPEYGREVLEFLSGEYVVELCGGTVRLYCTDLPADAVSAAMKKDGLLHVFLDLKKPAAALHARQMLREWLHIDCPVPAEAVPLVWAGHS